MFDKMIEIKEIIKLLSLLLIIVKSPQNFKLVFITITTYIKQIAPFKNIVSLNQSNYLYLNLN